MLRAPARTGSPRAHRRLGPLAKLALAAPLFAALAHSAACGGSVVDNGDPLGAGGCDPLPSGGGGQGGDAPSCECAGVVLEPVCKNGLYECPPCGTCLDADDCEPSQYCDHPDDTCGGEGTCRPRPTSCEPLFRPVCACDGETYDSACVAAALGADLSVADACVAPMGFVRCGALFCDDTIQYCEVKVSDVVGVPDEFTCRAYPEGCIDQGASCACLATVPCGLTCAEVDMGFTVTCT